MAIKLEYEIIKEGTDPVSPPEYSWEEVTIGITSQDPLIGFKVRMRVVDDTDLPVLYPDWVLVDQEITISIPDCGAETYTAPLEAYGGGDYAEVGIEETSGYIYGKVFNLTNFYYLPPFSGETEDTFSGELPVFSGFPLTPYDPVNNIYPMDTVTRFLPDIRSSVVVQYTINTSWALDIGGPGPIDPDDIETDEITVFHTVNQPSYNWAAQLQFLMQRTYFGNGIYH